VRCALYGIDGRTIVEPFGGMLEAGRNTFVWRPERRRDLGTNACIVTMKAGGVVLSQRIVLIRERNGR
jgi:hypothetical protein